MLGNNLGDAESCFFPAKTVTSAACDLPNSPAREEPYDLDDCSEQRCALCAAQLMITRVNCVLAGGDLLERWVRFSRRRQTARADVSVSLAPCPTCIFKEQLCFLLLLLLHANYRKRR